MHTRTHKRARTRTRTHASRNTRMRECTQTHTHTHTHTSSLIYTYANIPRYMCLPPTLVVSIWCAPTGPRQDLCGHPGAAPRPARRGVAAAAGGHHRRPGAHCAPPDRPPRPTPDPVLLPCRPLVFETRTGRLGDPIWPWLAHGSACILNPVNLSCTHPLLGAGASFKPLGPASSPTWMK